MSRAVWVIAWGLALAGAGCRQTDPESRNLVLTGSNTMAPLVRDIAQRFEADHPGVRVNVQGGGSERGISDAQLGLADAGMVGRALRPEEAGLHAFAIGRDGVAFLVHKGNRVAVLTEAQIVNIFTKTVGNWKQVGGADGPITVVSQGDGRPLLSYFLDRFRLKAGPVRADVTVADTGQAIKAVADNPGAIAYVSVGPAQAAVSAGVPVRLLPWGGVRPTQANVAHGSYPLYRPLLLVTRGQPQGLTQEFIDFARSPAVHDLVDKYHFVAAPP